MIAQNVAIVSPEIKAQQAQLQSGQAVGTFVDHLAAAATQQNQSGSKATATATATASASASSAIVSWHKVVSKSLATDRKPVTNTSLSNAAAALLAQNGLAGLNIAPSAASSSAANSNTAGAGTSTTTANTLLSSTALGTGSLQAAATLGTGTTIQLTTPSSNQSPAQLAIAAANPLGLSSTNAAATPAGTPTKANAAAALNLPANLIGQNQVSAPAAPAPQAAPLATALTNQPGSPAASLAINQNGPAATALPAVNAANTPNALPAPATATPAQPNGVTPSNTAATSADAMQAAAASGSNQPAPNATDLNARVVAGAATLAAQPSTATSVAATKLMQPSDPNAAVMPPAVTDAALGTKGQTPIGIATPTSNAATNGTISSPSTASIAHSFSAALEHTSTQTPSDTGNADTNGAAPSTSTGGDASTPVDASATFINAQSTAPSNTATPPMTDAATRTGMITLPASEQVAINLKQAITNGTNEIHIQLKPASLGAIDVKLNVNHDGRLTAVISADRSDTLHLLKQDAGSLQQSLQDAGFNADSSSLSFNLRSDTQSFAQNGSPQGNTSTPTGLLTDDAPAKLAAYAPRQHSGTIDIQA
jgi:flagellar hook-length control protein FliK